MPASHLAGQRKATELPPRLASGPPIRYEISQDTWMPGPASRGLDSNMTVNGIPQRQENTPRQAIFFREREAGTTLPNTTQPAPSSRKVRTQAVARGSKNQLNLSGALPIPSMKPNQS